MQVVGTVIVDSSVVVCVPREKVLLVREVCKHFSDRWCERVSKASSESERRDILVKEIGSMMKKMSIDCVVASSAVALLQSICGNRTESFEGDVSISMEHVSVCGQGSVADEPVVDTGFEPELEGEV